MKNKLKKEYMFGLFKGLIEVTGGIINIPLKLAAEGLGLASEVVQKAIDAGCTTVEEIKNFVNQE